MLFFLITALVLVSLAWLIPSLFTLTDTVVLATNTQVIELDAQWLLWVLMGLFLLLHGSLLLIKHLVTLRQKKQRRKQNKQADQAQKSLNQGLLHMIEGQYPPAEALLLEHISHSDTPALNYLALANIAQYQQTYDKRDYFLGKADSLQSANHSAIAIAQATMQVQSKQYELARATLSHMLERHPEHPTASALLRYVYYEQKDWSNLLDMTHSSCQSIDSSIENADSGSNSLIPNLPIQADKITMEISALKGAMNHQQATLNDIEMIWQRLPKALQDNPLAIHQYCLALDKSGAYETAQQLIISTLQHTWQDELIEHYGLMQHPDTEKSLMAVKPFLKQQGRNPHLLLCLARLSKAKHDWQQAADYYAHSINLIPNTQAYLELAELMESINEQDSAYICYKQGLRYSIIKTGEVLKLPPIT